MEPKNNRFFLMDYYVQALIIILRYFTGSFLRANLQNNDPKFIDKERQGGRPCIICSSW